VAVADDEAADRVTAVGPAGFGPLRV